jgi:hypothetical protein
MRQIAFGQIAKLTNTKIQATSVDFNLNGSVFIKELVVRPHKKHSYDDTILKAETVYARFGLGSLLLLHPRLKEIKLNDFIFNGTHNDGTYLRSSSRPLKAAPEKCRLFTLKRERSSTVTSQKDR